MGKSGRYAVEIRQPPEADPKEDQVTRFRRVAQELGCDEDEAAFAEKLKTIAKQKKQKPKSATGRTPSKPEGDDKA